MSSKLEIYKFSNEIRETIYNNSLFKGIEPDEINGILPFFTIKKYKEDDLIIEENTSGHSLYLLLEGTVTIDKNLVPLFENVEMSANDKIIRIVDASVNFYFGEMSLFDINFKRSASIIAKTDCTLAEIIKEDFDKVIVENKNIGIILLRNIAYKLSSMLDTAYKENTKLITAFTLALKS